MENKNMPAEKKKKDDPKKKSGAERLTHTGERAPLYPDELGLGEAPPIDDETLDELAADTWGTAVKSFVAAVLDEAHESHGSETRSGEDILLEYIVPVGFSLDAWKRFRDKNKTTPGQYAQEHPEKRWKVVHGNKKGEVGEPLPGLDNVSYEKATRAHRGIMMSKKKG